MWLFLLCLLGIKGVELASIGYPYRSLWTYESPKSSSLHGYLRYLDNNAAGSLVGINNQQPVYAVRQIKYFNSGAAPTTAVFPINTSDEIIKARETYLRAASLQQYQNLKSNIDALRSEGKEPSAENLSKLQMLEKIAFTSDFSLIAELPEVKSTLQELESNISDVNRESVQQNSNQQRNVDPSHGGEIKTYVGNSNIPLVTIDKTPEQIHAHDDHLRIYNEQIAHLKQLELEHQKYVQETSEKSQSSNIDKSIVEQTDNSKALAEFERAQQEHLRLWNEAKLRAEQTGYESGERGFNERANKQQISALTNEQNISNTKQTILNNENLETQQSLKGVISTLENTQKQLNGKFNLKNEPVQAVADTPEVVRARKEHLRIVSEASLRAQPQPQLEQQNIESGIQEENAKISLASLNQNIASDESQNLAESSAASNYRVEQSFAEETADVKKAREEHLRLVHEANLRAQYVEQQELKYKHESQTPILKSQNENQQHSAYHPDGPQAIQETPASSKARPTINNAQRKKQAVFSVEMQAIEETREVQRARDEHLRVFNSIKSHTEQQQPKQNFRTFPSPSSDKNAALEFSIIEERLLELERLREAERLQKEQKLLEIDRLREAERLAEEKREMEAELMRLRLEDEQRLEMERLLEKERLQQEQEELQKFNNGEYKEIIIQNDFVDQQPQIALISSSNMESELSLQNTEGVKSHNNQYAGNPFLKTGQILNDPANRLEHPANQQRSILKNIQTKDSASNHQHSSESAKGALSLNHNPIPQYLPSSHQSSGSKYQYTKDDNIKQIYHSAPSSIPIPSSHQYIKDDNIKQTYHSVPSSEPTDTEHYIAPSHQPSESKYQYIKDDNFKRTYHSAATSRTVENEEALTALEKATSNHFRAHEMVLEQLRLARLQNPSIKDCN